MSSNDAETRNPRVLFVYFTYTQQSLKVAEAMADVLRGRGCDVRLAGIELTDSRWSDRFTRFPLRHAWLDVLGMMPAQLRGATGEISIPDEARAGRILKSTPFATFVVCRRYWGFNLRAVRKLGTARGGQWVDGIHFSFAGGQIPSLLSLISYFGKGENRERYLGVKLPPTNLKADYLEHAQGFATRLADGLVQHAPGDSPVSPSALNQRPTDPTKVSAHE